MNTQKLALGTATFGMDYGAFNSYGQLQFRQVQDLIHFAYSKSINTLDTASSYGESETVLGQIEVSKWKIISKISPVPINCDSVDDWITLEVKESLSRLRVSSIEGVLLHKSTELKQNHGKQIWATLQQLKKSGMVNKIGYSIYETKELDDFWKDFKPDIIQAPLNLIDRRIIQSGWLRKLHDNGCEVHVRSVFLQGLLLTDYTHIPKFFKVWDPLWKKYHNWLKETKYKPVEVCLAFAMAQSEISKVIVGIDSLPQLQEILSTVGNKNYEFPDDLFSLDPNLLNPSNWRIS